jgi:hypothetical protein
MSDEYDKAHIYAFKVDNWQDTIKPWNKVPDTFADGTIRHHFFDAMSDARAFLVLRAQDKFDEACSEMDSAKRRMQKCERKFGVTP